ncbi:hypothetical protein D3C76_1355870 [compost metagenome]
MRQKNDSLNHVRELTDVAGPVVIFQQLDGISLQVDVALIDLVDLVQEVHGQNRDIAAPTCKGWKMDRDHVQAVVEVLPELAAADFGRKITVGRGDQSNVDFDLGFPAKPGDDALLQCSQ